MSEAKLAGRRRHNAELKRQVIAACAAPGASVAQVAMSYGLNANPVHKWRRLAADDSEIRSAPAFVPVSVISEVPPSDPPQSIELELQRGAVHVRVRWPLNGAMACAAWLRDVLERLPIQPTNRTDELLPHRWTAPEMTPAQVI